MVAEDQTSKGSKDQRTRGAEDQGTKGAEDQGTGGPGHQRTRVAGDQGTRRPEVHTTRMQHMCINSSNHKDCFVQAMRIFFEPNEVFFFDTDRRWTRPT